MRLGLADLPIWRDVPVKPAMEKRERRKVKRGRHINKVSAENYSQEHLPSKF